MKMLIAALVFWTSSAQAGVLLWPANSSSQCGPYRWMDQNKNIHDYTLLKNDELLNGMKIEKWQADLALWISAWFKRFEDNGDPKAAIHSMCYGFYDDVDGPNAFASGARSMLVGRSIVQMIWNHSTEVNPQAAYGMLLAHEFAHVLQTLHKLKFEGPTVRLMELHADCTAAYLNTASMIMNDQFDSNLQKGSASYAYSLGDRHFDHPGHHGTEEERKTAYYTGAQLAFNERLFNKRLVQKAKALNPRFNSFSSTAAREVLWHMTSEDAIRACARSYPSLN